jgi:hypothetical protein
MKHASIMPSEEEEDKVKASFRAEVGSNALDLWSLATEGTQEVQTLNKEDMATTTARRRRTAYPISHYWGMVKDMDDSQKLQLVTMLVNSVKPAR